MFDLKDKVAIITGASRGIGKGIAEVFSQAGATVICVSRSSEDVANIADSIVQNGGKAVGIACDISSAEKFAELVDTVVTKFEKVDILVNNAGVTKDGLIMRMKEEDWDSVIDINLKGAFNGIKAVSRVMMKQRYGRIINISSVVGLTGNSGQANYSASKAGLAGLTKSAAKEFASRNITVNSIAPGYIATDMTKDLPEGIKENLKKQIPVGSIGTAEDIGYAALYLASEQANYVTGQTLTVDGGMVM